MTKIICIEGANGIGKSTLIKNFSKSLDGWLTYEVIKDSEFPEFIQIRDQIRRGLPSKEACALTLETRKRIDHNYISPLRGNTDYLIFDRGFYTSLILQTSSELGLAYLSKKYMDENVRRPDITFILDAPLKVVLQRIKQRGRNFDDLYVEENISIMLKRYLTISQIFHECVVLNAAEEEQNILNEVLFRLP